MFVRLRISPPRIKLAASNFARRFIGIQGRESPIIVNFAPPEAQNRMNLTARGPPHVNIRPTVEMRRRNVTLEMRRREIARHVDVGWACVDIRPSSKMDVLVQKFISIWRDYGFTHSENVVGLLRKLNVHIEYDAKK